LIAYNKDRVRGSIPTNALFERWEGRGFMVKVGGK